MSRLLPVAVVAAALVLVALASHVVPPKYGRDRPPDYSAVTASPSPAATLPTPPTPKRPVAAQTHSFPLTLASYLLLGIIAVGLTWGLVNVLLTRVRAGRRQWRRAAGPDRGLAAAQLAARIETAVDEGLEQLAQGPVADAIIACWLLLEDAAGAAGISLRRSDTPAETVVRVLELGSGRRMRPEPLRELAELYREARFSRHDMAETARASARAALEDIRGDLARRDAEPVGDGRA